MELLQHIVHLRGTHPTLNITWSNHDLRAVWDSPSIAYHVIHIGNPSLVGGLEHGFYFSIYIYIYGNNTPNWRTHIFLRGGSTTNQILHDHISGLLRTKDSIRSRSSIVNILKYVFFFSRRLVSYQPFHLHGLVSTQTFNQLSVGA